MPSVPDSLEVYRSEVLAASVKLLGALGIKAEFPNTHDPADIVLDTLEQVSQIEDVNSGSTNQ